MNLVQGFLVDLWRLPIFFKLGLLWMVGASLWQWRKKQKVAEMLRSAALWPTFRARVIAAQCSERKSRGEHSHYYESILTYSYTVPDNELEVGEARKEFADPGEAESWAAAFRDTTVDVRVDPTDTKRSVWLEPAAPQCLRRSDGDFDRPLFPDGRVSDVTRSAAGALFCVSALGAGFAALIHVSALFQRPVITLERNPVVFFGLQFSAIACSILCALLVKHRTGATWSSLGKGEWTQLADQLLLIKILGAYNTGIFLYAWVRMASHDGAPDRWTLLMFSAVGLSFFSVVASSCYRLAFPGRPAS